MLDESNLCAVVEVPDYLHWILLLKINGMYKIKNSKQFHHNHICFWIVVLLHISRRGPCSYCAETQICVTYAKQSTKQMRVKKKTKKTRTTKNKKQPQSKTRNGLFCFKTACFVSEHHAEKHRDTYTATRVMRNAMRVQVSMEKFGRKPMVASTKHRTDRCQRRPGVFFKSVYM